MKEAFERIYAKEAWGKGKGSGTGSSPLYCADYLAYLRKIMREENHTRVLDLGCGDWQLYTGFNWGNTQYTGVDIVQKNIDTLDLVHGHGHRRFVCADFSEAGVMLRLIRDTRATLLIVKDVFQHWADEDIEHWLDAISLLPWRTVLAVNNWKHFRTPAKNKRPRDISNIYRWAPVDMRKYGFKDVLYYPKGKFKQVARLDNIGDIL